MRSSGRPLRTRRLLALAIVGCAVAYATVFTTVLAQTPAPRRTTLDKVYTKEQAARADATYQKVCASCHDPSKVPPGKKPAPPVSGDTFLDKWKDKTLGELITLVATTMPDDGSVVLTDDEAVDLVACILQLNGFPDGTKPLTNGDDSKDIVIVKPPAAPPTARR